MKLYLDEQPELDSIIKDFMTDLDSTYDYGFGKDVEPLECRSRDGFIPHSHNCGGYDKEYYTSIADIWGSGCDLTGELNTERAHKVYEDAFENLIKYDLDRTLTPDQIKVLQDIPKEKWNYHDLSDLGHSDIAETMDEYTYDWMRECSIWFGYRAMYEGKSENGWHTLMIYACANESEYWGMCGRGSETVQEHEVKFRNAKELQTKLESIKSALESAF